MSVAKWVGYPRSYTPGRNRQIQFVCLHYTAGSEGPTSAENGAAYDKQRTDGTSAHCYVDSNSVVREVPDNDRAHTARHRANEIGLHLEICGTRQTRAQWLDDVSRATLRNAAKMVAEWCELYDIPVRRLSVAQTRAAYYAAPGSRPKGIIEHGDATRAFPEDGGDHTDVGPEFPWDVFMPMVNEEMGTDMPTADEVVNALLNRKLGATGPSVGVALQDGYARSGLLLNEVAAIKAAVAKLNADTIAAGVVAKLPADADAVAISTATVNAIKAALREV